MISYLLVALTILSMLGICFYLVQIVSKARYSLYEIVVSYLLRGDLRGVNWISGNKMYVWYNVMLYAVIFCVLNYSKMLMFNARILEQVTFPFSAFVWLSLFFVIKGRCKQVLKRG